MLSSIRLRLLRSSLLWSFSSPASFAAAAAAYATVTPDGSVSRGGDGGGGGVGPPFDVAGLIATLPVGRLYINGSWTDPSAIAAAADGPPGTLEVVDPSTGAAVARVARASPEDVDRAVAAARGARASWSYHTSPTERRRLVRRLLGLYLSRSEDMARLVSTEMGSPIYAARSSHVGGGGDNIRSALEMMDHFEFERSLPNVGGDDERHTMILMEPVGVVGMITPWNWPLNQITLKVIPALLVGCTCVLKPSEEAPLSALLLAELVDQAGFPPGVFNLVNGDGPTTGDALTRHPQLDMVSFTGSSRAGRLVATNAALNLRRTTLELGGKGANILFADVGEEWMREAVVGGTESVFYNSGQTCNAPTRMFVQRPYYDMAVELAKAVAAETPVHSAHMEGEDHIGPVVSLRQFESIQRYIQVGIDEGATLVAGGLGRPVDLHDSESLGYFVRPTVFADCQNNMTIMQEEIFGPVLCITPFDTEEQVLDMANDTPYGLTNYVHSRDPKRRRRMARLLQSGMVQMNDAHGDSGSPFGGVKGSGYGREGGVYGMEEFCTIKAVTGFDEMEDDLELDGDENMDSVTSNEKETSA